MRRILIFSAALLCAAFIVNAITGISGFSDPTPIPVTLSASTSTVVGVGGNPVATSVSFGTMAVVNVVGSTLTTRDAEVNTFITFTTVAFVTSRLQFSILNDVGSTVVIKILEVSVANAPQAAVTGLPTTFELHTITDHTAGSSTATVRNMDSIDAALNASVEIRVMPTSVTAMGPPIGTVMLSSEETTVQPDPRYLYQYSWAPGKPLTLQAGQGLVVMQGPIAITAGHVGIKIVFTQE